jgi:hypothetical protein
MTTWDYLESSWRTQEGIALRLNGLAEVHPANVRTSALLAGWRVIPLNRSAATISTIFTPSEIVCTLGRQSRFELPADTTGLSRLDELVSAAIEGHLVEEHGCRDSCWYTVRLGTGETLDGYDGSFSGWLFGRIKTERTSYSAYFASD